VVTLPRWRIVYFGTPMFAVPTLTALIQSRDVPVEVVALVSQPDRPKGRGHHLAATPTKELAVLCGIPVFQPTKLREEAFLEELAARKPDLGVVAAYGRLLPDALLQVPRLGMLNVHASLLPKYRGAAPVHRAVIAGESVTGVTIMRVVQQLDAGPTFAAVERAIGPDDTSVEVERDLAQLGASLLLDVIGRMMRGEAVETPQDDAQATYAPKVEKSEGPIDWSLPAAQIHNLVRGLQPWPLASTTLDGARWLIHRTSLDAPDAADGLRRYAGFPPGTIVAVAGDTIAVLTGDGSPIRLVQLQSEGGRPMTAREFVSGHRLQPGARLGSG
jgi:methionyl-tRNA formyltransferase